MTIEERLDRLERAVRLLARPDRRADKEFNEKKKARMSIQSAIRETY
jgi:hypothetical protein